MDSALQCLPGFREFAPEDCAKRNYLFATWREVARRYGFVEWEGPVLEPTDLFRKKSGQEVVGQLFHFVDRGEREVALRPELTPSLARLAAMRERHYRKPLKWFELGPCYRYEKPQKGRGREFYQYNVDLLGEAGPEADAELIALAIDVLRELGFGPEDFQVRLSDRDAWVRFAAARGVEEKKVSEFLQIIDKLERERPEVTQEKLVALGIEPTEVEAFLQTPPEENSALSSIVADLEARGLGDFAVIDRSIVRGLAYYTGTVFELFDRKHGLRAIAGGGRYDHLIEMLSDGKSQIPAVGLGMGDMVLQEFIEAVPAARKKREAWLQVERPIEVQVLLADPAQRSAALSLLQTLRNAGLGADLCFGSPKLGKQFQAAEAAGAKFGVLIGSEYPSLQVKNLRDRSQIDTTSDHLLATLTDLLLKSPD